MFFIAHKMSPGENENTAWLTLRDIADGGHCSYAIRIERDSVNSYWRLPRPLYHDYTPTKLTELDTLADGYASDV